MSDSGVELRPSSRPQDESDLSSNEDYRVKMVPFCIGVMFNDNVTKTL